MRPNGIRVKICGITSVEDAHDAERAGADAIGLVFAKSRRQVTPDVAAQIVASLGPFVSTVGVFVNAPIGEVMETKRRCGLDIVQLHGEEDEDYVDGCDGRVIKAVVPSALSAIDSFKNATLLVDSPGGGSGRTVDWRTVAPHARKRPLILAGGLNPDNINAAIDAVNPYGVDVSSGVEIEPGRKDPVLIADFINKVKTNAGHIN